MEFNFVDHELVIATSDGDRRRLKLEPRTVADFYRDVMNTLRAMLLLVRIWPLIQHALDTRFKADVRIPFSARASCRISRR